MKTMLNIKIDKDIKDEAKKAADALGIPLSTVASALLRQFARDKEIHISLSYRPSDRLLQSIKEARDEHSKDEMKKHKTAGELFKSLSI